VSLRLNELILVKFTASFFRSSLCVQFMLTNKEEDEEDEDNT